MAKKGQVYKKYSPEFKLSVITYMMENHLGLRETERKHNIYHFVTAKWEHFRKKKLTTINEYCLNQK